MTCQTKQAVCFLVALVSILLVLMGGTWTLIGTVTGFLGVLGILSTLEMFGSRPEEGETAEIVRIIPGGLLFKRGHRAVLRSRESWEQDQDREFMVLLEDLPNKNASRKTEVLIWMGDCWEHLMPQSNPAG